MINLEDDGYCFVCGPKNPIGLKLAFFFDRETIKTEFVPGKEHQGYMNVVHGGIISTLLDEAMVKLSIELEMPAVTAEMTVRLKKSLNVGEKITVTSEINEKTTKLLYAYAKAVTDNNVIVAEATGKLVRVKQIPNSKFQNTNKSQI